MDTVIFTGRMPLDELKHDKPRLYNQLVEAGTLEQHLDDPPTLLFTQVAKVFGSVALAVGFTLVVLIIYAMVFAYR